MQTRKCHADADADTDADANADSNRIRTKNNMSPSFSVGGYKKTKQKELIFEITASWFETLCALYCATEDYSGFGSILSTHLQESAHIAVVDSFCRSQLRSFIVHNWFSIDMAKFKSQFLLVYNTKLETTTLYFLESLYLKYIKIIWYRDPGSGYATLETKVLHGPLHVVVCEKSYSK